jgi:hypothetical protein
LDCDKDVRGVVTKLKKSLNFFFGTCVSQAGQQVGVHFVVSVSSFSLLLFFLREVVVSPGQSERFAHTRFHFGWVLSWLINTARIVLDS